MKKSIILGIFAVLFTVFAVSACKAVGPTKTDFKTFKIEKSTIKSVVSTIASLQELSRNCETISISSLEYRYDSDKKITKDDHKTKDYALPPDNFSLKHPKGIHFTRHSRYIDRLYTFNRQVYSNQKICNLKATNKVRFS